MTGSPDRPRVVVAVPPGLRAQFFSAEVWQDLERAAELTVLDAHRDRAALAAALPGARALVTAWGTPRIDSELLDAADRLALVSHTGSAVAPYVTAEVFRRGIRVSQAGDEMARPVAEVALAFTLSLLYRIQRFDRALRTGAPWQEASQAPPRHEIHGSDIGVIGASRTGRAYIALVRAMGARVSVTDPFLTDADAAALGVESVPLETLLSRSRVVAVHAPVTDETHRMLGPEQLALMPDGAGLVNTARSWLVDEDALLAELASGRLDAAIDVFDAEPLPVDHPFRALPNVLLTPHQAAGSVECRLRLGASAVGEVLRLLAGQPLVHAVGADALSRLH
ncbi:hydroxyacid dehydrogenase [Streptomyces sp. NBC_01267]|uniref:hydroxyacid dehydrogenase n=1 Tax=unclassified Streptomyces TaxID=2593676 RepID=UPI0020253D21|nr:MULTISPECIES: hydroxyacid dehydrogenase [unclassified Streptomyces]MCX4552277.1 hydroxyacid dehydrogenase [Streptomyces sp. NBC_01500]